MRDLARVSAAVAVLVIVIASGLFGLIVFRKDDRALPEPDLVPLSRDLSERIAANLSMSTGMSDPEIITGLIELIPDLASSSSVGVDGYTVHVFEVGVELSRYSHPMPITSPIISTDIGPRINSLLYRNPSGSIAVPGLRADIVASIRLEPIESGEKVFTTLSISPEVIDAASARERLIEVLLNDISGPGNELGRDVEYMLNALARIRAGNLYGFKNKEGPANVLNQGDVELAINLALGLRIAAITGRVPEVLVDSIDRYFTHQNSAWSMNPTGFRQWGVSESKNFLAYTSMAGPRDNRRDVRALIDSAIDRGRADPADMLARYLYLEKLYSSTEVRPGFNPFDDRGALEETKLVNARQGFDIIDPNALSTVLSFQPEAGLRVLSGDPSRETPILIPHIDVPNGYLVSAREFRVKGLAPSEWYTDVDLNRTPESLVNINYSVPQTRCGGIVPPSKPPDHDFRMEWDLKVGGSLRVVAWADLWQGNRPSDGRTERIVNFSFPAKVLAWYEQRPFNDISHKFQPIYRTGILNTSQASGYIVPAEANATEFFEEYAFQALRGLISPLASLQRLVRSYGNITPFDMSEREAVQLACVETLRKARSWNANLSEEKGGYLITLLNVYLKKGALVPYLKPIDIDGLRIDLEWSGFSDRLDLLITSTGGSMILSIRGLLSPPVTYSASIDTGYPRIDLDITKKEFRVTYGSERGQYREGSMSPNPPDDALIGLALQSTWEACSPSYNVSGLSLAGFPYGSLVRDNSDAKVSYSFIVRGGSDDDPELIVSNLMQTLDAGELTLDMIVPVVLRSDGHWKGIRVREEVGGSVTIRTLWMRPDSSGSTILARDTWTFDVLTSIIQGGSDPGIPPKIASSDIAMETTYSLGPDCITFYRDISSDYPGLYAFDGHIDDVPLGWEVVQIEPPSPLW